MTTVAHILKRDKEIIAIKVKEYADLLEKYIGQMGEGETLELYAVDPQSDFSEETFGTNKGALYVPGGNGENVVVNTIIMLRAAKRLANKNLGDRISVLLSRDTHRVPGTRPDSEIEHLKEGHTDDEWAEFAEEERQELKAFDPKNASYGDHCIVGTKGVRFPHELECEIEQLVDAKKITVRQLGKITVRQLGKITFSPKSARLLRTGIDLTQSQNESIFEDGDNKTFKKIIDTEKDKKGRYVVFGIAGDVCVINAIKYLKEQGVEPHKITLFLPATHFIGTMLPKNVVEGCIRDGVHIEYGTAKKRDEPFDFDINNTDDATLVLGDIEEKQWPMVIKATNGGINIEPAQNFKRFIFAGDVIKGWRSTTNLRLLADLVERGQLSTDHIAVGNRDLNAIATGLWLGQVHQANDDHRFLPYVNQVKTKLLELIQLNKKTSCTYEELKQRYTVQGDNEPYVDLTDPDDPAAPAKALLIQEIALHAHIELKPDTIIDVAYLNTLFTTYAEFETAKQEQILIQFLHNSCFGCPDGYEKLAVNEWVEWIREELTKSLSSQNSADDYSNGVQALLTDLYAELDKAKTEIVISNVIIDKLQAFKGKFEDAGGTLDPRIFQLAGLPTNLDSLLGKALHARVTGLFKHLADTTHKLGKLWANSVVSEHTKQLSTNNPHKIHLHHHPLPQQQEALPVGLKVKTIINEFLNGKADSLNRVMRYNQPRPRTPQESVANNSYTLGFDAAKPGQVVSIQGHKPVPATLFTGSKLYTDISLPFNPNKLGEASVRIFERSTEYTSNEYGNKDTLYVIPPQILSVPANAHYVDGLKQTYSSGQKPEKIQTMKTQYNATKGEWLKGLPHMSVPFNHLDNTENSVRKILVDCENMKQEQAVIAGWHKDKDEKYIATIHALGKATGEKFAQTVIEVELVNLLKQINGLHKVPALFTPLLQQLHELDQTEIIEICTKLTDTNLDELSLDQLQQLANALDKRNNTTNDVLTSLNLHLDKYLKQKLGLISNTFVTYQASNTAKFSNTAWFSWGSTQQKSADKTAAIQDLFEKSQKLSAENLNALNASLSDKVDCYQAALEVATRHRSANKDHGTDTTLAKTLAGSTSLFTRNSRATRSRITTDSQLSAQHLMQAASLSAK